MQLEDVFPSTMRPEILLDTAKIFAKNNDHCRLSTRLLGPNSISKPDQILHRLNQYETELENARKCNITAYDMKLHIQVMAALLQELNLKPKL